MGSFTTVEQGSRWRARSVSGPAVGNAYDLEWPVDFLGYPDGIGADQTVSIDSIKLVLITDATVGNRRPRFRLLDPGNRVVEWQAGVTTPASANPAIYQFSANHAVADALVGSIARGQLPSGLWMQRGWVLQFDIIGALGADTIDEIVVTGSFHG